MTSKPIGQTGRTEIIDELNQRTEEAEVLAGFLESLGFDLKGVLLSWRLKYVDKEEVQKRFSLMLDESLLGVCGACGHQWWEHGWAEAKCSAKTPK